MLSLADRSEITYRARREWRTTVTGYAYLWEFDVPPANQPEFERIYGPAGRWVELFRRAPGYLGTYLLRDRSKSGRFVTIDRWRDEQAYREFRATHPDAYTALDLECEGFASVETPLGVFTEGTKLSTLDFA
jgi:heme-degrading monooxygenase HmoA